MCPWGTCSPSVLATGSAWSACVKVPCALDAAGFPTLGQGRSCVPCHARAVLALPGPAEQARLGIIHVLRLGLSSLVEAVRVLKVEMASSGGRVSGRGGAGAPLTRL